MVEVEHLRDIRRPAVVLLSAGREAPGGSSGDVDGFRQNTWSYQRIVCLLSLANSFKLFCRP